MLAIFYAALLALAVASPIANNDKHVDKPDCHSGHCGKPDWKPEHKPDWKPDCKDHDKDGKCDWWKPHPPQPEPPKPEPPCKHHDKHGKCHDHKPIPLPQPVPPPPAPPCKHHDKHGKCDHHHKEPEHKPDWKPGCKDHDKDGKCDWWKPQPPKPEPPKPEPPCKHHDKHGKCHDHGPIPLPQPVPPTKPPCKHHDKHGKCHDHKPIPLPQPVSPVFINPNGNTKWCIDVAGAKYAPGTPVQLWKCNATPAQHFLIVRGNGQISVSGTDLCLGADERNGCLVTLDRCNRSPRQLWTYTEDNRIRMTDRAFCLDLPSGKLASGVPLQVWTCGKGNTNQVWTTVPVGQHF